MATYPATPVPSFTFVEAVNRRVAITRYPSGVEQRLALDTVEQKRFVLVYNALTEEDMNTLLDFYAARGGALESFNFVHPRTGVSYVVRFDTQEPARTLFAKDWERITIELITVANESPGA